MSNANTFAALYNLPANSTATETAAQSAVGVFGVLGASTAAAPLRAILAPRSDVSGGLLDGHPFKLRVVAQGVASGAGNFTVNVYLNAGGNTNLTTFTNDVLVIGSGAQALASKSGVVLMEAILMWDSTLQQLAGFWNEAAGVSNIPTTPAIIKTSAAVTATDPIASTGVATVDKLQFFVTSSISANGSSAKILEFALDQI